MTSTPSAASAKTSFTDRPSKVSSAEILSHAYVWSRCRACPLAKSRFKVCDYRRYPEASRSCLADLLFIGEAPGESEDTIGRPFCGPAGDVLNLILAKALPSKATYCITNIVGCRPPQNRVPAPEEIAACRPRLIELVEIVQPLGIITLGKTADINLPVLDIAEIGLPHPAHILRMPADQQTLAVTRCVLKLQKFYRKVTQCETTL